jgi:hypothetical protein
MDSNAPNVGILITAKSPHDVYIKATAVIARHP